VTRGHEALRFAQLQTPTQPFGQGEISVPEEGAGEAN